MNESKLPSLAVIRKLLGTPSVASWKSWFQLKSFPVTSTTRDAMVASVEKLFKADQITSEQLELGQIEIEEAAKKLVFMYQIDPNVPSLKSLDSRLRDFGIPVSLLPKLAGGSVKPKLVYVINDEGTLRMKWVETHTAWRSQLPASPMMRSEELLKVIVFVLNKKTGRVEIRYDKPERDNPHKDDGLPSKEAYFTHYHERVEDICGTTLSEVEMRVSMERIVNTHPWLVELGHNEQLSEDGFVLKYSSKVKGKDVRNGKHYTAGKEHSGAITTQEVESMTWLPETSHGAINRKVFTHVNGRDGSIRFDAYCHEAELSYVLGHFISSQNTPRQA